MHNIYIYIYIHSACGGAGAPLDPAAADVELPVQHGGGRVAPAVGHDK